MLCGKLLQEKWPWKPRLRCSFFFMRRIYAEKALFRSIGKAVHLYRMIEPGDRIGVGLSGGVDSFTLLWSLDRRKARTPFSYELYPIYIDLGFPKGFSESLENVVRNLGFCLHTEKTDIGVIAHGPENRENPCFLCSRLRRKQLFEIAKEKKLNKIALGHTKDDLIETLFISICYSGEISTISPNQPFFSGRFNLIRPLSYTDKSVIERVAGHYRFPVFENPCPSAGVNKRQEIRGILEQLYRKNKKVKGNIFRSMSRVNMDYLLLPDRKKREDES